MASGIEYYFSACVLCSLRVEIDGLKWEGWGSGKTN